MLRTRLAALTVCLAGASSAAAQDPIQIAILEDAPFPGLQGEVNSFSAMAGVDHGWLSKLSLVNTGGGPVSALVGVRTPGVNVAPTVLRVPMTIGGLVQDSNFWGPVMAGGQVAYITSIANQPGEWAVWLESQLLMRSGDPVGATQDTWLGFSSLQALDGGGLLVKGYTDDGNGGVDKIVLLHYPSQQVLLTSDDVLSASSVPIGNFGYRASPNGQHALIGVSYGQGITKAIYLDGSPLDLGGGALAIQGTPIPESIAGVPGRIWGPLGIRDVNDAGDYTIIGLYYIGADTYMLTVRNGKPLKPPTPYELQPDVGGIDARGFVTWETAVGAGAPLLEQTPFLGASPNFDVDFDGVTDPQWQYNGAKLRLYGSGPRGEAFLSGVLEDTQSGSSHRALLRLASYDLGSVTCAGVANSSGDSGRLIAHRSDVVAANDLVLQCIGLPQDVAGIFLASRTSGFSSMPGGSQGNLCLGGNIGRLSSQVFASGLEGRGTAALDLSSLPQPSGPVAALPGETWYFQAWYRDTVSGASTSNFTDATGVLMR